QAYCKNIIQRPDLGVLSRICFALNCDVSDLIHYSPPEKPQKEE
ncbi:MAG: helix-turn-helix transcriptional regulator, partial [Oscillospiraceae bacterium]|nr:helix-turn-helix transcriptional regulator [Oscillospiraceae bacterium]